MGRLALTAIANGKISAFLLQDYKLLNHKTKKSHSFNLIRPPLQKEIVLEKMFIPTTSQHPHRG